MGDDEDPDTSFMSAIQVLSPQTNYNLCPTCPHDPDSATFTVNQRGHVLRLESNSVLAVQMVVTLLQAGAANSWVGPCTWGVTSTISFKIGWYVTVIDCGGVISAQLLYELV